MSAAVGIQGSGARSRAVLPEVQGEGPTQPGTVTQNAQQPSGEIRVGSAAITNATVTPFEVEAGQAEGKGLTPRALEPVPGNFWGAVLDESKDDLPGRWDPLRLYMRGMARSLHLSIWLTVATLPCTFLIVYAINMASFMKEEEGYDLHAAASDTGFSLFSATGDTVLPESLMLIGSGICMAFVAIWSARGINEARGTKPGRIVKIGEVIVVIGPILIPFAGPGWSVLGLWIMAASWVSVTKKRVALAIGGAITMFLLVIMIYSSLLIHLVSDETAEMDRIKFRVIWHTLMMETMATLTRLGTRNVSENSKLEAGQRFLATVHMTDALISRLLIVGMRTGWGTTVTVLAVSVLELVLRTTQTERDNFVARILCWKEIAKSPLADSIKSHDVMVGEMCETWATLTIMAAVLMLRAGMTREAPSPGPILTSAALQVLAEVVVDVLPALLSGVMWMPNVRRMRRTVVNRARAVNTWSRSFMLFMLFSAYTISSQIIRLQYTWGNATYCAWSKRNGWYHYVPCADSEKWAGLN